jgi:hypothetical protein
MPAGLFIKESDTKIPTSWVAGQTWWFDTVEMALKVWTGTEWLTIGAPGATISVPYDISGTMVGLPDDTLVIPRFPAVREYFFDTDMPLSRGVARVAATADTEFSLQKNDVEFGTMTFEAGDDFAVFDSTSTTFDPGDVLTVVPPATADATLEDVGFGLAGIRLGTVGGGGGGGGGEELLVNKNATNGYAGLSSGLVAQTQIPPIHAHDSGAGVPGAGTVARIGHIYIDTTNSRAYFGVSIGGNFIDFGSLGHAFNQVSDGTNSASASGSETLKFEASVNISTLVTAGSPDKVVHKIQVASEAHGDLLYYNGSDWVRLPAGAEGEVLTAHGAAAPTWE